MAAFITRFAHKLKSKQGESLTEVLVAILVSGLSTLMLAMGISVSANVNSQSRDAMHSYYEDLNKAIVEGMADNVGVSGMLDGTAILQGREEDQGSVASTKDISIKYVVGTQESNGEVVVSYKSAADE